KRLGGLQVARFLARNHPRILMYHRISPDGAPGTISVDQFREQIRLIKRSFEPISLTKLVKLYDQGIRPNHAVAVTFDDGYKDFAEYAFPILKEEGVPATLFVTTGFVNGETWLWPDQIRYLLKRINHNELLSLCFEEVNLKNNSDPDFTWQVLANYCLSLEDERKNEFIDELFKNFNIVKPGKAPPEYEAVSWEKINDMVGCGLELGCHSHTHPVLKNVHDKELYREIFLSKKILENNIGMEVSSFCYPNGQIDDFDERVKVEVKNAGYKFGVSAYPSTNPLKDCWAIGRYPGANERDNFEKILFGFVYLKNLFFCRVEV
ncbi:polysaccharide deacetylase family protein, partial [Corallibacter sp.]|uniref:polysaccharide deacetylase family protein n=1 Tax=Corallibacter sp. TaxID=2038084 RepID=UPI003AB5870B